MSKKNSKALVKAKKARDTQNRLMLSPSFLKATQLLTILQKTPKEHIYTRPGKGGGTWEYVTGTYVKKVLNYVFGWLWDFDVVEHGKEGEQVWVLGKLTVKDKKGFTITKTQFGRADIKFKRGTKTMLDYGNDLKAATTDALKKCASELGIASDIYGKNEFREVKIDAIEIGGKMVKDLATPKETNQIENLCREMGYSDPEKAYDFVKKITGIELLSEKLTKVDASIIIAKLLEKQVKNGK